MKKLLVELADDHIKRQYGLMDRKELDKDAGMLFEFPNRDYRSFWMQDTYIPLDIAFIDDRGEIFQIEQMVPLSTRPVTSCRRCRYALETNKGWFKENGLGVGSIVGLNKEALSRYDLGIKVAQEVVQEEPNLDLNLESEPEQDSPPDQDNTSEQQEKPQSANATDAFMNRTKKQRFQRLNAHNRLSINRNRQLDMLIFYQTEEYGKILLPRLCRGPFRFSPGVSNGELVELNDVGPTVSGVHPNGKKWECKAGFKTFIINDILHMTEVVKGDPSQDMSSQIVAWYKEQR